MQRLNDKIIIKGARVNNLKNIDVEIPHQKLVIITGVSGSGKSSLAFDTLFIEGQRRYIESLSSYARQFLTRLPKPEVDFISGIPPAIAIEQKTITTNPRSTVGTSTEIYEYLKLLYARIGKTYSPINGKEVKKHTVADVLDFICHQDAHLMGFIGFHSQNGLSVQYYIEQGYTRAFINNSIEKLESIKHDEPFAIVLDRFEFCHDKEILNRLADSIETAFFEGRGECIVGIQRNGKWQIETFSNKFESGGMIFEEPHPQMFNFNSPAGACPTCEGFGQTIGIDEDLVIPNQSLSVYDDAVACWKGETLQEWKWQFIHNAHKVNFPIHSPYYQLTDKEKEYLWNGSQYFEGINDFFNFLKSNLYKIQYRVLLSRYRGKTLCPTCKGKRLKPETENVKIQGKSLGELLMMPISELFLWFDNLKLGKHDYAVAERLLIEIKTRLQFLINVGLSYLTLNRSSATLSGGESQRVHLSTSLGSSLVGSLYILDEPTIGLHPYDTHQLLKSLFHLRDIGNTVVVVEHDEEIIRSADYIIDVGPLAGHKGGEIVFSGSPDLLCKNSESLTAKYLRQELSIALPERRKTWKYSITVKDAYLNNLKHIDVTIPLQVLTVVTGVSGSGKSSLITDILYTAIQRKLGKIQKTTGFRELLGDVDKVEDVQLIDQNPIGRSTRSNALTYLKIYDDLRLFYSELPLAKKLKLKPSYFSFNIEGGRCEECKGEGYLTVDMQFLADVKLVCEACQGKRFKPEILEIEYKGKSISDLLDMTVDEAITFFSASDGTLEKSIANKLCILQEVGLGYLTLGQSTSTLSGGEAQRLKLALFLSQPAKHHTLFIFDEPSTGLHLHDVQMLLKALNKLVQYHHTVVVIEHHLDIIKSADWIIDLGPGGGENGGYIVACGLPEEIVKVENSITGQYLKSKIKKLPSNRTV
ncbi:MAG: excinuclease ABC subunit UvrA [Bacteroidales bacterium]|nr:excinuclease ABC subunit UvrA [Bacteroidales bacterium]